MKLPESGKNFVHFGVPYYPPLAFNCSDYNNNATCPEPGISVEITQLICATAGILCNFTLIPGDVDVGNCDNRGCTGMLGEVVKGRFDAATPLATPHDSRKRFVNFTEPVLYVELGFLTKAPELRHFSASLTTLMPFQITFLLTLVLAALVLGTLVTFYQHAFKETKGCSDLTRVSSYIENSIHIIGSPAERSPLMLTTKSTIQLLFGSWALAAVVFSGVYSGVLLKHMLSVELKLPFEDMKSLAKCVKSGECQMVSLSLDTIFYRSIEEAKRGALLDMHNALKDHPPARIPYGNVPDSISKPGPFRVMYGIAPSLLHEAGHNCSVWFLPDNMVDLLAFVFQRNNSLVNRFNRVQATLTETGVVEKLINKYGNSRLCEAVKPKAGVSAIPLEPIMGAIFLLLIGSACGVTVFLSEKIWKKRKLMRKYSKAIISGLTVAQEKESHNRQSHKNF